MSLVLYAAGSNANHSYAVRSTGVDKVQMVETTVGSLADPLLLTQSLSLKGPNAPGNQRYSVSIRRNVTDPATKLPYTGSISSTVSIPKNGTFTDGMVEDLCSEMASVLGACKAYGASGTVVSGCTDTTAFPKSIANMLFVGL